ncbi:Mur ligase family protein [Thermus filiformis]|uniref:UDP-N-acetylmuramyl-tripeptide synthetase n=1 Tax=Thermus filiformis TaxID=276 RepID=A0A0A2WMQ5_THEFI|nr:UDP-N-acetylmuramoyl-L-alanyl-D-glutamate--2,6-diaminopimelate ligase [Thermus filiformis]KGQ21073.1 UDP-N-acetylmuramyl peptide synthase [Thermus filiformis]
MTLKDLLAPYGSFPALPVRGLALDSRRVEPGFLFFALPGVPLPHRKPLDGHDFALEAVQRGAVAVVGERPLALPVPYLQVEDGRQVLAEVAARFHGHPERALVLLGVTGSKGKSTTAALLHHLLQGSGLRAALLSTVGWRFGEEEAPGVGHFTTPEAPEVYGFLARARDLGLTHAVLEVSSHALALKRVEGLGYRVGVFVNFYPDDHLDFHGTAEAYFRAKALLLERSEKRVVNRALLKALPPGPYLTFGEGGEVFATRLEETPRGLAFTLHTPWGEGRARLPLLGAYNLENALAAVGAGLLLGLPLEGLLEGLATFPGLPGRMEVVREEPFRVVIDFAHTGKSLEAALLTLRKTAEGRLLLVVGAAGERDVNRRTEIAKVAARLADLSFFTEEDHRTEPLEAILEAMAEAARKEGGRFVLVPDRREAIRKALEAARPGDTVLLAGKGHERTLERGSLALPWNEKEEALRALAELGL